MNAIHKEGAYTWIVTNVNVNDWICLCAHHEVCDEQYKSRQVEYNVRANKCNVKLIMTRRSSRNMRSAMMWLPINVIKDEKTYAWMTADMNINVRLNMSGCSSRRISLKINVIDNEVTDTRSATYVRINARLHISRCSSQSMWSTMNMIHNEETYTWIAAYTNIHVRLHMSRCTSRMM